MIDSLKDVVVICGRGDAIGVVDVTGAEWLRCEVCFVWILEFELRKDCFKIVGRHEGELWIRECDEFISGKQILASAKLLHPPNFWRHSIYDQLTGFTEHHKRAIKSAPSSPQLPALLIK